MKSGERTNGREHSETARLDAALRRSLDPDAAAVDRLVRAALAERPKPRHAVSQHAWGWATAVATLVIAGLSLAYLLPDPSYVLPPTRASQPTEAEEPVALSISNEFGPVTVITAAGAKMIFLPGDDR